VRHVAIAGLQFAAALGQLLVGQLDVHGTGLDVDVDDVAVLDERHRALVRRLGSHVPDGQTRGAAGVATVGEHGDLLADALALDEGRRVQHLLHARAALRTLVTNHQRHAGLQRVVEDHLDGLLLRIDHQCRSAELPDLLRHARGLDDAAVGSEVAAQHGETALVDLRMVDVVDGAVGAVAVQ